MTSVRAAAALLIAAAGLDALPAHAQAPANRAAGGPRVRSAAVERGRHVVVIDLDSNRLFFTRGRRVLWSAPVGTGTGLRLETDRNAWDFKTPNGTFHVAFKAIEPDWVAPDWYFLERGLPIPPQNDPKRRFPRGLGAAAVYIGHGLAIHGTDKPELLGQRVSHGCIRLSDADALRLYHNVQVGTEIMVVGGSSAPAKAPPPAPARRARATGEPPPRDPLVVALEREETADLLDRLDDGLVAAAFGGEAAEWPRVASVLLLRGAKQDDDQALTGLMSRIRGLGNGALRDEYSTFVVDALNQAPLRTLDVLGRMDRPARTEIARVVVDATVALYPGETTDRRLPWPTRRAPREVLEFRGQRAWDALHAAETSYREARGLAVR
jgi:lipoprotein-anchoring transpeptidase ErfK/SrfK